MAKKTLIGGYGETLVEYQPPLGIGDGGIRVSGRGGSVLLDYVALQAVLATARWLEVEPSPEMIIAIGNKIAMQLERQE